MSAPRQPRQQVSVPTTVLSLLLGLVALGAAWVIGAAVLILVVRLVGGLG